MSSRASTQALETEQTPLDRQQRAALEQLVRGLDAPQLNWVSGYLAGLARGPVADAGEPSRGEPLHVLFASQTGNASRLARVLNDRFVEAGVEARLTDVRHFKVARLKQLREVLFVASTHGEGDPPDSAQVFFRDLLGRRAPRLDGLRFSVLSLGDRGYEYFCETGRVLDERLEALGAKRLHERVDCDVDFDDDAAGWMDAVLERLGREPEPSRVLRLAVPPAPSARTFTRSDPYRAVVVANQRLSGRDSSKYVCHVELDVADAGFGYAPGDSLAVVPRNDQATVEALLAETHLDASDAVSVGETSMTLNDALSSHFEVTTLTRQVIERYATATGASELTTLLNDREALRAYLEGRDLLDLLRQFPSEWSAERLTALLRRMPGRSYSIASGPQVNPDEIHLTVARLRYDSRGRERRGVASNHLAERAVDKRVDVYLEPNENFRLPEDPLRPIIMVGAGTGVAPYRAFMEQRESTGAAGPAWLVFGDRTLRDDFLYQAEWLEWRRRGLLARLDVAFSRDQAHKVYVQDRLRERAADVFAWLDDGAHLYVCGDANHMAPDVHATLLTIVADGTGSNAERAGEYLDELMAQGRYQRDVY